MTVRNYFLYPAKQEPVQLDIPVRVDSWFRPLNEPTRNFAQRRIAAYAIALIASGPVHTLTPVVTGQAADAIPIHDVQPPQSARRTLYQSIAEPVAFAAPAEPDGAVVMGGTVEPPRDRRYAIYEPLVDVIGGAETTTADRWFQQFPDPVRRRSSIPALMSGAINAPAVIAAPISTDVAVPVHDVQPPQSRQRRLYQTRAEPIVVAAAPAAPSMDSWYVALGEPLRTKRTFRAVFVPQPPFLPQADVGTISWFVALSEPVRARPGLRANLQQTTAHSPLFFGVGNDVGTIPWAPRLEEPVRRRALIGALQQIEQAPILVQSETVTLDKWYQPLQTPVRRSARTAEYQAFTIDPTALTRAESVTEDRWHQPWSEPVRRRARVPAHLADAYNPFTPVGDVVTVDKWYRPLEEPVRTKRRTAELPAFTIDPRALTLAEATTVDRWHQPFSEPVRKNPRVAQIPDLQQAPFTPAGETVTLDKWFRPFDDPVRLKRRTADYPATTIDPRALTQPETTTVDRWHQPWIEPVRRKPRASQFPDAQMAPFAPATEIITVDKWFSPFNEPVRIKRRSAEYQSFTIDPFILTQGETVTLDKWFQPFSERLFGKRGLRADLQQAYTGPDRDPDANRPPAPDLSWFAPFSEPVRLPPRLLTGQNQFLAQDTAPEGPIVMGEWFRPWNEPVRLKPRLRTAGNQFEAMDPQALTPPEVPTVDRWLIPFSQPVRIKRRVPWQMNAAWHIRTETVTVDKWFMPWREPVRRKRGLRTGQYQFTTISPAGMTLTETILLSKWYRPLNEPVRRKRGLSTAVQSTSGIGSYTPPPFVPQFAVYAPMTDTIAVDLNPCCEEGCD